VRSGRTPADEVWAGDAACAWGTYGVTGELAGLSIRDGDCAAAGTV